MEVIDAGGPVAVELIISDTGANAYVVDDHPVFIPFQAIDHALVAFPGIFQTGLIQITLADRLADGCRVEACTGRLRPIARLISLVDHLVP